MALVISDRGGGYFLSYINQRIERNKNFLCAITGQTGSGKSLSALRIGETLDKDFDIRNVCFSAREFLELVDGKVKPLKKGSVLVWDEMQVSMNSLDFQNLQSKLVNYILQTFRYQGFVLIISTPFFSFINASSRKLFHSRLETISINKTKKICTLKPLLLQTNQDSGEIYRKYLRVKTPNGIVPVTRLNVTLPSKELRDAYEKKKDEFNIKLRSDITKQLSVADSKDICKPLTEQQQQITELLVSGKLIPEIAQELNVSQNYVHIQLNFVKKKGITITPEKEKNRVLRYNVKGYSK